jgi:hypothetical protein
MLLAERCHRIEGVGGCWQLALDFLHFDARLLSGYAPRHCEPILPRSQSAVFRESVPVDGQPPHRVNQSSVNYVARREHVTDVRGIERASKETDMAFEFAHCPVS